MRRFILVFSGVAALVVLMWLSPPLWTVAGGSVAIQRISVGTGGTQGNNFSEFPSISVSANGRFVAFASAATTLVSPDSNGAMPDILLRDRIANVTERVSVSGGGAQANAASTNPALSAEGRWVAFESTATNLVANDTNGVADIFVHDRETGQTQRVSVDSAGNQAIIGGSNLPHISADGRWVVFESSAPNLVANDTNNRRDIFLHDRNTATTELVSVDVTGDFANGDSSGASVTPDGRYVVFASVAGDLVEGDDNNFCGSFSCSDIFVRDRVLGTTELISVATTGAQGDEPSQNASISDNGRWVVWDTQAETLVGGDENFAYDVFLRDRTEGATTRVSVAGDGTEADNWSREVQISAFGNWIVFFSWANNLVGDDANGLPDIYRVERGLPGTIERVSLNTEGGDPDDSSYQPSVTVDGQRIAFMSNGSDLVADDTNGVRDVFLRNYGDDNATPTTTPTSTPTQTPFGTPTHTRTPTATATAPGGGGTPTRTPTASTTAIMPPTFTPSPTGSLTVTPTMTRVPGTLTATATPIGGPPKLYLPLVHRR